MTGQQILILILTLGAVNGVGYGIYQGVGTTNEPDVVALQKRNADAVPPTAADLEQKDEADDDKNVPMQVSELSKSARLRAVKALEDGQYRLAVSEFRKAIEEGDDSSSTVRLLRTAQNLASKPTTTTPTVSRRPERQTASKVRRLPNRRREARPTRMAPMATPTPPTMEVSAELELPAAPAPAPAATPTPTTSIPASAKKKTEPTVKQPEMERNPYLRGN